MSCNAREALKNAQHSGAAKQLIQQVDTRWNSHFDMFERMLELKTPLMFVLSQLDMQSILKKDWILIEAYVEVSRPLKYATVMMSVEKYPTASMYIPVVLAIIFQLNFNLKNYSTTDVKYQLSSIFLDNMNVRYICYNYQFHYS